MPTVPAVCGAVTDPPEGRAPFEVSNEYDVQDLLHGLLKLQFNDVRPEEYTGSYGGNASRVDFYLPQERIIIEAKMTSRELRSKRSR